MKRMKDNNRNPGLERERKRVRDEKRENEKREIHCASLN